MATSTVRKTRIREMLAASTIDHTIAAWLFQRADNNACLNAQNVARRMFRMPAGMFRSPHGVSIANLSEAYSEGNLQ